MNRKLPYLIIAGIMLVVIALAASAMGNPQNTNQPKDFVIFSKSEGWGPCPPGQKCESLTQLWKSGNFLKDGILLRTLSQREVDQIVDIIKKNDLMTLTCDREIINDYSFT